MTGVGKLKYHSSKKSNINQIVESIPDPNSDSE